MADCPALHRSTTGWTEQLTYASVRVRVSESLCVCPSVGPSVRPPVRGCECPFVQRRGMAAGTKAREQRGASAATPPLSLARTRIRLEYPSRIGAAAAA